MMTRLLTCQGEILRVTANGRLSDWWVPVQHCEAKRERVMDGLRMSRVMLQKPHLKPRQG